MNVRVCLLSVCMCVSLYVRVCLCMVYMCLLSVCLCIVYIVCCLSVRVCLCIVYMCLLSVCTCVWVPLEDYLHAAELVPFLTASMVHARSAGVSFPLFHRSSQYLMRWFHHTIHPHYWTYCFQSGVVDVLSQLSSFQIPEHCCEFLEFGFPPISLLPLSEHCNLLCFCAVPFYFFLISLCDSQEWRDGLPVSEGESYLTEVVIPAWLV